MSPLVWNGDEASWVSAGAAVAVVAGSAVMALWRGRRYVARVVEFLTFPFTGVHRLNNQVTAILKELQPNGGTSIRDTINRLETKQSMLMGLMVATWDRDTRPIFQADSAGHFQLVNHAFTALTGRQRAEVMGMGWINTVRPLDRERVRMLWAQALAEKRAFEEEFGISDLEGRTYRVAAYASPVMSDHGAAGMVGHWEVLEGPSGRRTATAGQTATP